MSELTLFIKIPIFSAVALNTSLKTVKCFAQDFFFFKYYLFFLYGSLLLYVFVFEDYSRGSDFNFHHNKNEWTIFLVKTTLQDTAPLYAHFTK